MFLISLLTCDFENIPARCIRRLATAPVRDEPPVHQLCALHVRLRGLRRVAAETIPQIPVRPVLLGTHELIGRRGVEVRINLLI